MPTVTWRPSLACMYTRRSPRTRTPKALRLRFGIDDGSCGDIGKLAARRETLYSSLRATKPKGLRAAGHREILRASSNRDLHPHPR